MAVSRIQHTLLTLELLSLAAKKVHIIWILTILIPLHGCSGDKKHLIISIIQCIILLDNFAGKNVVERSRSLFTYRAVSCHGWGGNSDIWPETLCLRHWCLPLSDGGLSSSNICCHSLPSSSHATVYITTPSYFSCYRAMGHKQQWTYSLPAF